MIRLLFLTLLAACVTIPATIHAGEAKAAVVFLVRHAEKAGTGKNPDLSPAGKIRAAQLAHALRDSKLTELHSSGYTRTRETAAPTAKALGLETRVYDPGDLPALVEAIRKAGGTHLVVGHSNTTPKMVELLGGDPGSAIDEDGEFDRLYVLTLSAGGDVQSTLLRYGAPFERP